MQTHGVEQGRQRKPVSVLRYAIRLRIAAYAICFLGLAGLVLQYMTDWQQNLFPAVAAMTNPLTFLALLSGVLASLMQRPGLAVPGPSRLGWAFAMFFVALAPISEDVARAVLGPGDWGRTGINTALAIGLLALSQMMPASQRRAALVCLVLALGTMGLAISGYLMGETGFYGALAPGTLAVLLPLSLVSLMRFARTQAVMVLLREDPSGRLLRRHLLFCCALFIGVPLLRSVSGMGDSLSLSVLHTFELFLVMAALVYFGTRQIRLIDKARHTENALLSDLARDPLTGVASRKAAVDRFLSLTGRQQIGLILLDIDHFKSVNDRFGHIVGDRVLQAVAAQLQTRMQGTDMVARWGGEEFLILCRLDSLAELRQMAEDLREAVCLVTVPGSGGEPVTASLGAVLVDPREEPELGAFVHKADQALYRAKDAGRDRVVLDGDALWPMVEGPVAASDNWLRAAS
ncbi:sensor domain-containing diguanylate cyclase [Pacificoceanicola onchidii]|uniref:GGDEF domain-containing protein n=1 Tax=Pacificoceanicola onchidii TaxID=2562685 RepID=UPI0010A50745|nr:GGDEF domain-containing protein [Pacificoceanicola onchidii]